MPLPHKLLIVSLIVALLLFIYSAFNLSAYHEMIKNISGNLGKHKQAVINKHQLAATEMGYLRTIRMFSFVCFVLSGIAGLITIISLFLLIK